MPANYHPELFSIFPNGRLSSRVINQRSLYSSLLDEYRLTAVVEHHLLLVRISCNLADDRP
jgi:hypothetical protein